MEKIIKNGIEYIPGKTYYVAHPRNAWDTVKVGLFDSYQSCANSFPNSNPKTFVKEATQKEIEEFFHSEPIFFPFDGGLVHINEKLNRIEILFEQEPNNFTRVKLNGNRFRYDPRVKGWHREYTNYTKHLVNYILNHQIFK